MDRTDNMRRRTILICFLLCGITFVAYWPVFQNDFIKLDDRQYVVENPHVLGGVTWPDVKWAFQPGYASNWHPLTWLSHMLDVQFFGLNPGWHHLGNLVLHVANVILLFLVLRRMTGAIWCSAFVATIFAVHPLHVESVAWVAERKDVLSGFFFFLTLWAYVRYTELDNQNPDSNRAKWSWYATALILFALGLMSKSILVTLPCVLLLLDFWPLQRLQSKTRWRLLWEKIPFLCLAMASCVATYMAEGKGHAVSMGLPLGPRIANVIASYVKYLGKTLWPANLSVFYPHPDLRYPLSTQWPDWQILVGALLVVAVCAFALLRHKRQPWFVTGWFWYLGTLVPVIGIIQVGKQGMADRYTYIPLIGVFVCCAWGANELLAGLRSGKTVLAAVGILVTTACVLATQKQVKYWRNDFTLFEHALTVTPNNPVAHHLIGADLQEQHKYDLALTHFRAAVESDPNFVDAYCSLGFTLYAIGKMDEAIEQYQTAIRLNPWHAQAHTSLGALLWMRGRRTEAVEHYAEALQLRPDLAMAHYNMGIALSASGRFSEAAAQLSEALRLNPRHSDAHYNLGVLLAKQGKTNEAISQLQSAVSLDPGSEGFRRAMQELQQPGM